MNQYYIQFHIIGVSKHYASPVNIHPEPDANGTTAKIIRKALNDANLEHLKVSDVVIEVLTKLN